MDKKHQLTRILIDFFMPILEGSGGHWNPEYSKILHSYTTGIIELATEQIEAKVLKRAGECVSFDAVEEVDRLRLENERLRAKNAQLRLQGWRWLARDGTPKSTGWKYHVAFLSATGRIALDSMRYDCAEWSRRGVYAYRPEFGAPPPFEPQEVVSK